MNTVQTWVWFSGN